MDSRLWLLLINGAVSPSLLALKSPGRQVQGILRRLVAGVARDIDGLPERMADRVHDIRVRMKKFRAVLRLAERGLKSPEFAKSDKLARRLKDHFGSVRDEDVQTELLLDLLDKKEALETAAVLEPPSADAGREPDLASARETCSALAALVDAWKLDDLASEDLAEAWVASYRNSRRGRRACVKDPDDDFLFHEWRKRVKAFLYQSSAIGAPLDAFVPRATKLASELGSHHDLAILTGRLARALAGSKAERAALAKKKAVARRALATGRKLLAKKPSRIRRKAGLP